MSKLSKNSDDVDDISIALSDTDGEEGEEGQADGEEEKSVEKPFAIKAKKETWQRRITTIETEFGQKTIGPGTQLRLIWQNSVRCYFDDNMIVRAPLESKAQEFACLRDFVKQMDYPYAKINLLRPYYAFEVLINKSDDENAADGGSGGEEGKWLPLYRFLLPEKENTRLGKKSRTSKGSKKLKGPKKAITKNRIGYKVELITSTRGVNDEFVELMTRNRCAQIQRACRKVKRVATLFAMDDFFYKKLYVFYEFREPKDNAKAKVGESKQPR